MSRQAVRRLLPSDLDRRNDSPIPSDEVKNSHAYTERRWYEEAVFLRQFLPFVHQQRIKETGVVFFLAQAVAQPAGGRVRPLGGERAFEFVEERGIHDGTSRVRVAGGARLVRDDMLAGTSGRRHHAGAEVPRGAIGAAADRG